MGAGKLLYIEKKYLELNFQSKYHIWTNTQFIFGNADINLWMSHNILELNQDKTVEASNVIWTQV